MKKQVVIHGHFYQPPRENPWSGVVEKDEASEPYHDWNERMLRECYAANASSRVLDPAGRIESIVNNYEFLSFAFCPHLLHWLENQAPRIYRRIIDADQRSVSANKGHGNAMAHGYDHTILPLATPEEMRLQILWGLKDFEYRFGRPSEGFWVPEMAVNNAVIDMLIDCGVRYLLLSPGQIARIRQPKKGISRDLYNEIPDPHQAYRIIRSRGYIDLLPYHPGLSEGISFHHYLRDADRLFQKIREVANNTDQALISLVADGEIFGHYEPFGDMCLASLRNKIARDQQFEIVNYGRYLEEHPPVYEAELSGGPEGRGTSWSCPHGVARWMQDCGCRSGGPEEWSQQWRLPLREGLRELRKLCWNEAERKLSPWTHIDAEKLFFEYIDVRLGAVTAEDFIQKHLNQEISEEEIRLLLSLCEGICSMGGMFNSSAWFFADVARRSTIRNLTCSYRAITLIFTDEEEIPLKLLVPYLEQAKSNLNTIDSAAELLRREVLVFNRPLQYYAAVSVISFLHHILDDNLFQYGCYSAKELSRQRDSGFDGSRFTGQLEIFNTLTLQKESFFYEYQVDCSNCLSVFIGSDPNKLSPIELRDLPDQVRDSVRKILAGRVETSFLENNCMVPLEVKKTVRNCNALGITPPRTILQIGEVYLETALSFLLSPREGEEDLSRFLEIFELLKLAGECHLSFPQKKINDLLSAHILVKLDDLEGESRQSVVEYLSRLMKAFRATGFEPDIPVCQNRVFHFISRVSRGEAKDVDSAIHLGGLFGIQVEGLNSFSGPS